MRTLLLREGRETADEYASLVAAGSKQLDCVEIVDATDVAATLKRFEGSQYDSVYAILPAGGVGAKALW